MPDMTPDCCKKCENKEQDHCRFRTCAAWRAWFSKEWAAVRDNAAWAKARDEGKGSNGES